MEEKKLGAYICTGCGIGEALPVESLTAVATKEFKVPVCKTHPHLCGAEGVALIKEDMASEGVNSVVIAACSPRVHYDTFDLGMDLLDRVNLREQVIWSHPAQNEDTTALAADYLRMGLSKIKKMNPPVPFTDEGFSKAILVVGGGMTGLNAALEAGRKGYPVILVEQSDSLGGFAAQMRRRTPSAPPYADPEETGVVALIAGVQANPNIKVLTNAKVQKTSGGPGLFDVEIGQGSETLTERVGAIVMATGWKPYNPNNLGHLGYGSSPDIITNVQMEEMAKKGSISRPSNGEAIRSVAFIQCAGSRDPNHLPYCSSVCCEVSIKQALYAKEQDPKASTYVIYQELRTPGQAEDFYRAAQRAGVIFIKSPSVEVSSDNGAGVSLTVDDQLVGERLTLNVDLAVLATGMVPAAGSSASEIVCRIGGPDTEAPAVEDSSILNLQYRQGPDLPILQDGFPDSHFICFPYETRRTGIYTAGPVRRPMGLTQAIEDGAGAALKAIQAVESTIRGAAIHPRSGDLSYPKINLSACTQCKRCTEECPFGALNEDEKTYPVLVPTRCRRCGTCMGACPVRAISFDNYSVDIIGSMLKSVEIPEEEEEKPRVLIFACENDAYPAFDMAGIKHLSYNEHVRVLPVRCLGSLNLVWIADALSSGYDGIMLFGCRHGDDYQCHFVKGSELANIRLSKVSETLTSLSLEPERVMTTEISITDAHRLPEIISDFMATMERIGPNPYKGF